MRAMSICLTLVLGACLALGHDAKAAPRPLGQPFQKAREQVRREIADGNVSGAGTLLRRAPALNPSTPNKTQTKAQTKLRQELEVARAWKALERIQHEVDTQKLATAAESLYQSPAVKKQALDPLQRRARATIERNLERALGRAGQITPQDMDPRILRKAIRGGRYSQLLRVLYVPEDERSYGLLNDFGAWNPGTYHRYKNLPAGHWVFADGYWFIWGKAKEGNGSPAGQTPKAQNVRMQDKANGKIGDQPLDSRIVRKAARGGRYSDLLRVLPVPEDSASYGHLNDFGRWDPGTYSGYKNLPAGHWVFVDGYWFIWGKAKEHASGKKRA